MEVLKPINFKEKKLIFAFAFLIMLTLVIGLVGISQIQRLNRRIEDLGKHNLRLEGAVLEMRVNNTIYAMGIRNYVFWKSSHYLGAAPMAINLNKIIGAGENFKNQLKIYRESAYLTQQKEWAGQIAVSGDELFSLGKKIVELTDRNPSDRISDAASSLLMAFENRVYKIDEFLDSSMSKANLREVERQMFLANADKNQAILFLRVSLLGALVSGTLIAFSVYRRRLADHNYRQQLFNRMINIEESERKKLSTAVHDEMGQGLSALKIYLGLVSQELLGTESLRGGKTDEASPAKDGVASPAARNDGQKAGCAADSSPVIANPPKAGEASPEKRDCFATLAMTKEKIEECRKITSDLIDKSHNIAFLLRPPDLDEVGLLESLESLLLESQHLTGVEYIFQKPSDKLELSPEYSLLIYRIAQELLTNMAKHARARNVEMSIKINSSSVELFYRDNGQGFDYNQAAHKLSRRQEDKFRLGLSGLKERVEVLDGSMFINSSLGKGTSVDVVLPI